MANKKGYVRDYKKEYAAHREKVIQRATEWNKNNPDKAYVHKRSSAIKKYGITLEQYEALRMRQDYKCGICKKETKVLAVDHCHVTGKVRGLLCKPCNSGIGFLNDDIDLIKSALEYLNETTKQESP